MRLPILLFALALGSRAQIAEFVADPMPMPSCHASTVVELAGGRVMATHLEYTWLYNVAPFSGTASWNVQHTPSPADQIGYINQSTDDGLRLAQWSQSVGATTTQGQIPLQLIRHHFDGVIPPSQSWLGVNDANFGNISVQYSFGTPVGTTPR